MEAEDQSKEANPPRVKKRCVRTLTDMQGLWWGFGREPECEFHGSSTGDRKSCSEKQSLEHRLGTAKHRLRPAGSRGMCVSEDGAARKQISHSSQSSIADGS